VTRPRVLVVEDEPALQKVLSMRLGMEGFDVETASDGEEALSMIRAAAPDLVLTDLMMPVMDGAELIRRMRADPKLDAIPAILMTALPEAVPTGHAALHDAVLVKPFSIVELLATIRRLLPPA
jgi:CheY-like chemotaxis protein